MNGTGYCPQCGTGRMGEMRFCTKCGFDFQTVQVQQAGAVTSLLSGGTQGPPARSPEAINAPNAQAATPPATNDGPPIPLLVGIAWLVGAAATGYLALLQLEYSGLGMPDSSDAFGTAIWNGAAAVITAYFGTMAIIAPSRQRMAGGVVWAILNVAFGVIQVSEGFTHPAFLLALVAMGLAGILSFAAWRQFKAAEAGATR